MRKLFISILLMMTVFASAKMSLSESFLTERKVVELTLSSPDTAYAIIQTMRERKLITAWRLDCLEAEYYINQRQYRRVVPLFEKVLDNPAVADSTILKMRITMHLMRVYDKLQEDDDLTETMYRMEKMVDKTNDDYFKAHLLFMLGKRLHYQGDKTGLEKCNEAINLLRATNYKNKNNSLRSFYGYMLLMYQEDGNYNDAIRMSLLQEETARIPSHIKMRYLDSRALRITYALRASLYAEMGEIEEADKAYGQWLNTKGGNPIDDKYILGYLETKGLYDEALNVIYEYKKHLSTERDSVSHWMLTMLGHESIIYGMLNRVDESLVTARKIKSLTETLHKMESRQTMTNVYKFLQGRDEDSRRNVMQMSIGFMLFFMIISIIAFLFYAIYYYRRHKKFKGIFQHIASKFSKKNHREIVVKRVPVAAERPEHKGEAAEYMVPVTNDLAQLYDYMDMVVTRDRLFLDPALNRDELMKRLGIDKNRFGKMMAKYSESRNISVYINTKRVEYGAELLKDHPEYTIATIAEMSGASSTVNFNRMFRSVFGVTPSEYRKQMEEKNGGG